MAEVFRTERLVARDWTPDDADGAYEVYRDPEVMRFLGRGDAPPVQRHEVVDRITYWMGVNDGLRDRGLGFWALCTFDGTLVGASLLKPFPDAGDEVEVGWHLGKAHWGKGYATEGARGAIAHAFDVVGLDVLYAVVDPANAASLRVAHRLGMTYEGRADRYYGKSLELFSLRPDMTKAPA
jgi:RimJ/RimL family protein N-acetyltransferase